MSDRNIYSLRLKTLTKGKITCITPCHAPAKRAMIEASKSRNADTTNADNMKMHKFLYDTIYCKQIEDFYKDEKKHFFNPSFHLISREKLYQKFQTCEESGFLVTCQFGALHFTSSSILT